MPIFPRFTRRIATCLTVRSTASSVAVPGESRRRPTLRTGVRPIAKAALSLSLALTVAACALPEQQLPPGTSIDKVYATLGQPKERYDLGNGVTRLLWPTKPYGETTTAVDVDTSGKVLHVAQVLDNNYFYQAIPGQWTEHDVLTRFGKPLEIEYFSLMKRRAWTYRYMDSGVWFEMFTFLFDDNGVLQSTQKSPDPLHDPDRRNGFGF